MNTDSQCVYVDDSGWSLWRDGPGMYWVMVTKTKHSMPAPEVIALCEAIRACNDKLADRRPTTNGIAIVICEECLS